MAGIKLLFNLIIFVIKTINSRESDRINGKGKNCKYCQKGSIGKDICVHILFRHKMQDGVCPREKCGGFNSGNSLIDDNTAVTNIPWLLSIKKFVDLFPEFAVALLALNEIISN